MTDIARPSEWGRLGSRSSETGAQTRRPQLYFAFLSYSHADEATAAWLHDSLEKFHVPRALVGRLTEQGVIPSRLMPIFRDLKELPAAGDLSDEIRTALSASRCLVVLCSPTAAKSKWTNREIETFRRAHPEGCVLAAILSGEPFASEIPGKEEEECLPPALQVAYDSRGRATGRRAEPLCADIRGGGEARRIGFLKLVAGMLGIGLDELVRREIVRRHRRMAMVAVGSMVGMLIATGLAVTAIEASDAANDQRREAESLIEFMVGDLRTKLEPIGRLDVLDGVAQRALAYYQDSDVADLSDDNLLQRSQALSLMGQLAHTRGDFARSKGLYRLASAGTSEAVRRHPDDPNRLYEHAQNVFWLGDIARRDDQWREAELQMREYQRLAQKMVSLDPDNMKWRMEAQMADTNLGVLLYDRRRFDEARDQFGRALRAMQALSQTDPGNEEYKRAYLESLAWYADANLQTGQLNEALGLRARHVALLRQALARKPEDTLLRQRLVPSYRALANIHRSRGDLETARKGMRQALSTSQELARFEPENQRWQRYLALSHLGLGSILLDSRRLDDAGAHIRNGCEITRPATGGPTGPEWRSIVRSCLTAQARLALLSDEPERAIRSAEAAVRLAPAGKSQDPFEEIEGAAEAGRLLGDARAAAGERDGARTAWQRALQLVPKGSAKSPGERFERAMLLKRLGRPSEARQEDGQLRALGFRYQDHLAG